MKIINYKDVQNFKEAMNLILQFPTANRKDVSRIHRIEKALGSSDEVLKLESDDYDFLNSQIDFGFERRMFQFPKKWETIINAIDKAKDGD